MNVRGARLDRVEQQMVDQSNDRRSALGIQQVFTGSQHVQFAQHRLAIDRVDDLLCLAGTIGIRDIDRGRDCCLGCQDRFDRITQRAADDVQVFVTVTIANRDQQPILVAVGLTAETDALDARERRRWKISPESLGPVAATTDRAAAAIRARRTIGSAHRQHHVSHRRSNPGRDPNRSESSVQRAGRLPHDWIGWLRTWDKDRTALRIVSRNLGVLNVDIR